MNWQRKQVIVSWKNIPSINLEKKKNRKRGCFRGPTLFKKYSHVLFLSVKLL